MSSSWGVRVSRAVGLPQGDLAADAQIEGGGGDAEGLEHAAHRGNGDAVAALQTGNLGFLHAHPLAQLFLGEILQQARFFDGFADVIGVDGFGHFAFVFVAFGSAYFAIKLCKQVFKRRKFHFLFHF